MVNNNEQKTKEHPIPIVFLPEFLLIDVWLTDIIVIRASKAEIQTTSIFSTLLQKSYIISTE